MVTRPVSVFGCVNRLSRYLNLNRNGLRNLKRKPLFALSSILIFSLLTPGCRTVSPTHPNTEHETVSAVGSVAGALSGKTMSDEDTRHLMKKIQSDPQARSAVEAITAAGAQPVVIKYCPVDGKRFSSRFVRCPEHDVSLKILK